MGERNKSAARWTVGLVALPVLLAVATIGAVAWKIRAESQARPDARLALAAAKVSSAELRAHYRKLADLVGPRDWESVEGRKSIRRAIAFIDGTLSPQNYGFEVQRGGAQSLVDELWPTVWADMRGEGNPDEVVVVAAPYDRGDLAPGALLAIANDLREERLERTVRFVFYPARLLESAGGADFLVADGERVRLVLGVNAFSSARGDLWLTDGASGGHGSGVTPDGFPAVPSGPAASIAGEKAVFGTLGAPLFVVRGGPDPGESSASPSAGTDGDEEAGFAPYVARSMALRNLIRDLGQAGAKRP